MNKYFLKKLFDLNAAWPDVELLEVGGTGADRGCQLRLEVVHESVLLLPNHIPVVFLDPNLYKISVDTCHLKMPQFVPKKEKKYNSKLIFISLSFFSENLLVEFCQFIQLYLNSKTILTIFCKGRGVGGLVGIPVTEITTENFFYFD